MSKEKKETKNNTCIIRLSDKDVEMIKDLMYKTDFNKSEVIRRAIQLYYCSSNN